jgi:hypothetical protein
MVLENPATVPVIRDGKASQNRDKSEDLPDTTGRSKLSGRKAWIISDSTQFPC